MNKQIARELGTTERTIKAHRQKVMEKLRAESLAELVLIAERFGILASSSDKTPAMDEGTSQPLGDANCMTRVTGSGLPR